MLRAIEEDSNLPVPKVEDIPKPLFASKKMIDRDIARVTRSNDTSNTRTRSYMPVTSQAIQEKAKIPSCYHYTNTFSKIDATPRTAAHIPGTFTSAELEMFDPVFRAFIQDCYDHGIPGPSEVPKSDPSTKKHDSLVTPYQFAKQQQDAALSPQDESFNPYWDIQAWRKWVDHVAVESRSHACSSSVASVGTKFAAEPACSFQLGDSTSTEDAAWWLSDEFLADTSLPAPNHHPLNSAMTITTRKSGKSVPLTSSILEQPARVSIQQFKLPRHADMTSHDLQPLLATMRATVEEGEDTHTTATRGAMHGTGKGMLRRPSRWLSRRMMRLRGVV